jgi:hypothetical protein
MKNLLLFLVMLPSLLLAQIEVEVGYKVRIVNQFGNSSEIILAFDQIASDGYDPCCDAIYLAGNNVLGLYTKIVDFNYSVNCFGNLTSEKVIPLYTFANPDIINFVISLSDTIGTSGVLVSLIDNQFPNQKFALPYTVSGPITGQRFSLEFTAPIELNVVNGCESDSGATIYLNNPNNIINDELLLDGEVISSNIDSVLTNVYSGSYEYRWSNGVSQQSIYFDVVNNPLDYSLILPQNYLYINDPQIIPEVIINTPYDSLIWNFGDGSPLFYNDVNPVHTYQQVGQYVLSVTIYSGECVKKIEENITVDNIFGFNDIYNKNKYYLFKYGIDGRLHRR